MTVTIGKTSTVDFSCIQIFCVVYAIQKIQHTKIEVYSYM